MALVLDVNQPVQTLSTNREENIRMEQGRKIVRMKEAFCMFSPHMYVISAGTAVSAHNPKIVLRVCAWFVSLTEFHID